MNHRDWKLLITSIYIILSGWQTAHSQGGVTPQTGSLDLVKFEWSNKVGSVSVDPGYFLQDSKGLIWMASSGGVVSFDGYNFKVYSQKEYNLSTSRILRLAEDIHGNIWIFGFRNSSIVIDVMNPRTETVQPLHRFLGREAPIDIPIREEIILLHNINGKIWVGTSEKGYSYDGTWKPAYNFSSRTDNYIMSWPAPTGFWVLSPGKKTIMLKDSTGRTLDTVLCNRSLWLDDQLNLWGADTEEPHLYRRYSEENGRIFVYETHKLPSFKWTSCGISPPQIQSPHLYGYAWRTDGKDLYLSRNDGTGEINLSRRFPEITPNHNFFFDREGGIWTATKTKIIHLTPNPASGFRTILTDESLDRSVRGMTQIRNTLYVNSYKGDCSINLDNYKVTNIDILNGQGLTFLQENNGFWVGGHSGKIARIEPGKANTILPFNSQTDITCFLRCSSDVLVGTSTGLFSINGVNNTVSPTLLQNSSVFFLYKNAKGIWACTSNGLFIINEQGRVLSRFLPPGQGVDYEKITHILEESNGNFWLATKGAGLIEWSEKNGILRHFTTNEGLSNNDIHAIYDDGMGYLWLPSNYGLMRLHKESGQIQVFFKRDGIADNEFNSLSHFQSADGRLFLGGVNGITVFYPKDIPLPAQKTPKLQLIEARSFRIKSGTYLNHLPDYDVNKPVCVDPDDDYLDIRVSPLLFEDVNQIKYSWKIEGYSDNWIQQQSPLIRLYNLPYGTHNLRIRYTMQGNIWSENEVSIPLSVSRPFYLTPPFFLLLIVIMLLVAWVIGNWRARNFREVSLRLEQEVKKRTRQIESDKQVIEQQARELRSLDEVKSRFFANITHELRTPLTLITGPVDMLLREDVEREKTREYILTVKRNAAKLLNLVEELLDLSKMEANKLVLNEKPVWLQRFLTQTVSVFIPYARHRGINIELQFRFQEDIILLMDTQKWEKIINNLLNNALKFTPSGGQITIEADVNSSELIIDITDTGSGISPNDLPFIFDRYYQARTSGQQLQGGAGIGLSLCHEYMKLFGGTISVESTLDEGSKFTLRCPLKTVAANELDGIEQGPVGQLVSSAGKPAATHSPDKRTLLLVEDDMDMSDFIQGLLAREYNLITAENGKKALQILDKKPVDLVLSDVMMPEMDGFQLLKSVRSRFGDIPFIMLTARADTPDRLEALSLGVDDYLTKPFLPEELTARLKNLISRYDTRKSAQAQTDITGLEPGFDQKWLRQLETVVRENIVNPDFTLDELAGILKISRRSLYNKIMANAGMTPNQYLTDIRLIEGHRLLKESGEFKTIAEVCYAVGMKTPDYFSKLLKERFG